MLPLGLDLKSIIVGILLAYFILPRVLSMFQSRGRTQTA
jgi:hypothetical protein